MINIVIITCAVVLLIGTKRAGEYFIVLILCYLYPPVALAAIFALAIRFYLKSK